MWSYLTTRSFLNPLASLVESKSSTCETPLRLDDIGLVLVRFDYMPAL